MEHILNETTLPIIFATLMGIAVLMYVILDGYDLGVGILTAKVTVKERHILFASIAPFWDANETWLVLGIGLLLVGFPIAHGIILRSLYIPIAIMLSGLILRGVAFEFRSKATLSQQSLWDKCFAFGSCLAALSQGYILGFYVMGFQNTIPTIAFSIIAAFSLSIGYVFVGSCWLIMKTDDALQQKCLHWARLSLWGTAISLGLISLITPLISPRIFSRWFSLPNFFYLMPIPVLTGGLVLYTDRVIHSIKTGHDSRIWFPFMGSAFIFILSFIGLSYSFFPYLVPESITIWDAASSTESLTVIFYGAAVVLPFIFGYTIYSYKVFWGKAIDTHGH